MSDDQPGGAAGAEPMDNERDMDGNGAAESAAGDYKVDLEVFEGPLDLLLYLIRKDEIDICDIRIERITTQYLEYLDMMKMLDLDVAGEFIVMAASLMLIKSRTLLPVETRPGDEGEEEEADPRLDLVRQLVEYKKFKDASASLMRREFAQADCYLLGGDVVVSDADETAPKLADIGLFDLLTAFQEALKRAPVMPLGQLKPIIWSVPEKMRLIEDAVTAGGGGGVAFSKLFTAESPRGEVIVSFLALLELLKQHRVGVRQNGAFTEIMVCPPPAGTVIEAGTAEVTEYA